MKDTRQGHAFQVLLDRPIQNSTDTSPQHLPAALALALQCSSPRHRNGSLTQHLTGGTFPSKANISQKHPNAASAPGMWDGRTVTLLDRQVSPVGSPLTGEIC